MMKNDGGPVYPNVQTHKIGDMIVANEIDKGQTMRQRYKIAAMSAIIL